VVKVFECEYALLVCGFGFAVKGGIRGICIFFNKELSV